MRTCTRSFDAALDRLLGGLRACNRSGSVERTRHDPGGVLAALSTRPRFRRTHAAQGRRPACFTEHDQTDRGHCDTVRAPTCSRPAPAFLLAADSTKSLHPGVSCAASCIAQQAAPSAPCLHVHHALNLPRTLAAPSPRGAARGPPSHVCCCTPACAAQACACCTSLRLGCPLGRSQLSPAALRVRLGRSGGTCFWHAGYFGGLRSSIRASRQRRLPVHWGSTPLCQHLRLPSRTAWRGATLEPRDSATLPLRLLRLRVETCTQSPNKAPQPLARPAGPLARAHESLRALIACGHRRAPRARPGCWGDLP